MIPKRLEKNQRLKVDGTLASGSVKGVVTVVSQGKTIGNYIPTPVLRTTQKNGLIQKGHQFVASWEELGEIF